MPVIGAITIAIFNPLFYILVLYALTFASVAYLGLTRELSVLITVLMASLVLGECDLRQRLFWAAVMLVGNAVGWSDPEG